MPHPPFTATRAALALAAGLVPVLAVHAAASSAVGADGMYFVAVLPVVAVSRYLGWREGLLAVAAGVAGVQLAPVPDGHLGNPAGAGWTAMFAATGVAVAMVGRAAATAERAAVCRERDGQLRDRLWMLADTDMIPMAVRRVRGRAAGLVVAANDAWLRLAGRTRDDLADGRVRWDGGGDAGGDAERRAMLALGDRAGHGPYPHTCRRPDGAAVPVTAYLVRLSPEEVLVVCLDESERAAATDTLRGRAADLAAAARRKDEALAMLAHELRGPLAPIRNAAHLIRVKGHHPAERERWTRVVEESVEVLVRLVDDLLDVARLQHGKVALVRQTTDLGDLVAAAVEAARPLMAERRHRVLVGQPPDGQPVYADVDPSRVSQVVANLLTNAARYTPRGGAVEVSVAREGADAVVRVRDTGEGIAPEYLDRVWEPFVQQRVPGADMDRPSGGLGLGLTLVKRFVELHGGRVEAHSPGPGGGSEFVVRLPAQTTPWKVFRREPGPPAPAGAPRRVLVVEDDYVIAESTAAFLRVDGHEVTVLHDGPAAVAATPGLAPDVVLLDIGLPGMSGYEVARRLRAAGYAGTLVAVTGYAGAADRVAGAAAGFDLHLPKPVAPETIREVLARPAPPLPADRPGDRP